MIRTTKTFDATSNSSFQHNNCCFMMTSSNGNISALLATCAGNSPVTGEFPAQRSVTRRFDVFFVLRVNKRLRKQSWDWWFETPSHPLWRHCNVYTVSLNCGLSGGTYTVSSLLQGMAYLFSAKPLRETMPVVSVMIIVIMLAPNRRQASIWSKDGQFTDAYIRHSASMR